MSPCIRRVVATAAGVFAATFLLSGLSPAGAQSPMCNTHEKLTGALDKRFGEKRKVIGLVASTGLMEIYVSASGTWTVIVTNPAKLACIVAAGHSWDEMPAEKELTGLVH